MFDTALPGRTTRELLADPERKWVFATALALGGTALGWAAGAVAAGQSVAGQFWLLPVLVGVLTVWVALAENVK